MKITERIKGVIIGLTIGLIIGSTMIFAANGTVEKVLNYVGIKITLDDKEIVPTDADGNYVEPFIMDGTTYLPVRGIANALGLNVEWDGNTKTVKLYSEKKTNTQRLKVATNAYFRPFEYYNRNELVGIDIEIMRELAKYCNMETEFYDMEFSEMLPSLASDSADCVIAGITATEERKEMAYFTVPYYTNIGRIVVCNGSDITSVEDLYNVSKRYSVGTLSGTTEEIYAMDDFGEQAEIYEDLSDMVLDLRLENIDCIIINQINVDKDFAKLRGLKVLESEYFVEDYAIAVAKDNPKLLEMLNYGIKKMIANGKVEEIVLKYLDKH